MVLARRQCTTILWLQVKRSVSSPTFGLQVTVVFKHLVLSLPHIVFCSPKKREKCSLGYPLVRAQWIFLVVLTWKFPCHTRQKRTRSKSHKGTLWMLPAAGTNSLSVSFSLFSLDFVSLSSSYILIFKSYPFICLQPNLVNIHIKPTLLTFHCTLHYTPLIFYPSLSFSVTVTLPYSLEEALTYILLLPGTGMVQEVSCGWDRCWDRHHDVLITSQHPIAISYF